MQKRYETTIPHDLVNSSELILPKMENSLVAILNIVNFFFLPSILKLLLIEFFAKIIGFLNKINANAIFSYADYLPFKFLLTCSGILLENFFRSF